MRKIIVTGGAGYIGSHTVVELHNSGYDPIIVDDFSNSDKQILTGIDQIIGRKVKVYEGDCQERRFIQQILRIENEVSGIIHFAAFKAVGESVKDPLKYYQNNILSLTTLLREITFNRIPNFVFSSSCTVYGEPEDLPVTEKNEIKEAKSPYGNTKIIGERIISDLVESLRSFKSESNFRGLSLRYFNPVGAHPSSKIGELPLGEPANLIPYVTQTVAGWRKQLTVFGDDYNTEDGTCVRDYIHVVDLAKAHVSALQYLENHEERILYDTINVGVGKGYSVKQIIDAFEQITGEKINYKIGDRRTGDVEQVYADVSKARELLKWQSKESIEEALLHAWNWQKTLTR
jgi:UDP-glucose 4-epimerase